MRRQSFTRFAAAAMLVAMSLPLPVAAAQAATVTITDTLKPRTLNVAPGTTVTWENQDGDRHRVRSQSGPEEFDSGNLEPGQSFSYVFNTEGTYSYVDDRDDENSAYHGTVVVAAGTSDPGNPGGDPGGDPAPPPGTGDVTIVNDSFRPSAIQISVGGAVTWANNDREHTVTATDGSWDSGIFDAGQTYTRTFPNAGTFAYLCLIHPEMTGTVTVVGDGGTPPEQLPPPEQPPPPPQEPPQPPPAPPPGATSVDVVDFAFSPRSVTVAAGSQVVWVNSGGAPHTVTDVSGGFDSGFLFTNDTYSRTFSTAGTYSYLCTLHPEMTGTITVTGDANAPPPPPTPPPAEEPAPPGNPTPPEDPVATPGSGDISVIDNAFSPTSFSIATGTTIRWVNNGALPHTVTAADGSFDSGFLFPTYGYSRTFTNAGTFAYLCTVHPEMTGTITVTGEPTAPPETVPPPTTPPNTTPPSRSVSSDIRVVDNAFRPATFTVAAGTTVRWANDGALPHTVTAADGSFDSGILVTGGSYRRTFNNPGTYSYVCTIHPGMTGAIRVTGQATGAADESPDQVEDASATQQGEPSPTGPTGVAIFDNGYDPDNIEVAAGQTVTWANTGELPHTVTAQDGTFDSGFLMAGDEFSHQFSAPGVYEYLCTIHPEMVATVTVLAGGAGAVTAADATTTLNDEEGGQPLGVGAPAGGDISQEVAIIDLDYEPPRIQVTIGETVLWTNDGDLPHTVTAREGAFDSGIMNSGDTYTHVFGTPGEYEYFCTLHPNMVGYVNVVDAQTAAGLAGSRAFPPPADGNTSPVVGFILAGGLVAAMTAFAVAMLRILGAAGGNDEAGAAP